MQITTQDRSGVAVLYVSGELSRLHVSGQTLHQAVKSQLEQGKINILLNLGEVDFIDSFGVGQILASFTSTQNLGGKIKLARISRKLDFVFMVTGLKRVLDVFDDETSALQSFAEH
jgi:anti-sigma B factor antagonist